MRRGPKPAESKVEAKRPVAHKSPKDDGAKVRDPETRLAEALKLKTEALQREAEALKREAEAREQQAATAEFLRVISQSRTDVQPVFDAIAENALRLLHAWSVAVYRSDGDFIHFAAARGGQAGSEKYFRDRSPWAVNRNTNIGRCIVDRTVTHIPDIESDAAATKAALDAAHATAPSI